MTKIEKIEEEIDKLFKSRTQMLDGDFVFNDGWNCAVEKALEIIRRVKEESDGNSR